MTERPIPFNTPMVQALLDGRKTQTRRLNGLDQINEAPNDWAVMAHNSESPYWNFVHRTKTAIHGGGIVSIKCPYGTPGDRLWVRETFALWREGFDRRGHVIYRADMKDKDGEDFSRPDLMGSSKWYPSIHMKRGYSRLTLEISEIRVQRLQEISEEDAKAEGITRRDPLPDDYGRNLPCSHCGQRKSQHVGTVRVCFGSHGEIFNSGTFKGGFYWLWESINGPGSWAANPWVWCVSFKKVRP